MLLLASFLLMSVAMAYVPIASMFQSWHPSCIDKYSSTSAPTMSQSLRNFQLSLSSSNTSQDIGSLEWDPLAAPKLNFNECYYTILEITTTSSFDDIKKSYHKIVLKHHPDNRALPEDKDLGNKQMMVINAAYKILKDAKTRSLYDAQRIRGIFGAAAVANFKGGSSGSTTSPTSDDVTNNNNNNNKTSHDNSSSKTKGSQFYEGYDEEASFGFRTGRSTTGSNPTSKGTPNESSSKRVSSSSENKFDKNEVLKKNTVSPSAARFRQQVATTFSDVWEREAQKRVSNGQDEDFNHGSSWIESEDNDIYSILNRKGDGSLSSLMRLLERIQLEYKIKRNCLDQDTRDWGEVTNAKAIERRLKEVEDIRLLLKKISELEAEINLLKSGSSGASPSDWREIQNSDGNHRYPYDNDDMYSPYEPQRQRSSSGTGGGGGFPQQPRVDVWDDFPGSGSRRGSRRAAGGDGDGRRQ